MSLELNRRGFLAAAGLASLGTPARAPAADETSGAIKLGVASYSLREYSRALAIRCIKELRTPYVSVKEFHLPYRSSPEELDSGRKEFERAGLTIVSGGNISLAKDLRQAALLVRGQLFPEGDAASGDLGWLFDVPYGCDRRDT